MQAMRGHNILQNAIEIVKAGSIEQGNKDLTDERKRDGFRTKGN